MDASRFTITLRFAMRNAPRDRELHRHHHRKQLWGETDGKSGRKQEGFDGRAAESEMGEEHE